MYGRKYRADHRLQPRHRPGFGPPNDHARLARAGRGASSGGGARPAGGGARCHARFGRHSHARRAARCQRRSGGRGGRGQSPLPRCAGQQCRCFSRGRERAARAVAAGVFRGGVCRQRGRRGPGHAHVPSAPDQGGAPAGDQHQLAGRFDRGEGRLALLLLQLLQSGAQYAHPCHGRRAAPAGGHGRRGDAGLGQDGNGRTECDDHRGGIGAQPRRDHRSRHAPRCGAFPRPRREQRRGCLVISSGAGAGPNASCAAR